MRRISILLIAGAMFAAEPPKPLQEIDALRLENAELRAKLALARFEVARLTAIAEVAKIRSESEEIKAEVLKREALGPEQWQVDLPSRRIIPKEKQ